MITKPKYTKTFADNGIIVAVEKKDNTWYISFSRNTKEIRREAIPFCDDATLEKRINDILRELHRVAICEKAYYIWLSEGDMPENNWYKAEKEYYNKK